MEVGRMRCQGWKGGGGGGGGGGQKNTPDGAASSQWVGRWDQSASQAGLSSHPNLVSHMDHVLVWSHLHSQ